MIQQCVKRWPDRKIVVVSGGCPRGADSFAEEAARSLGLDMVIHPVVKPGDPPIAHRGDFAKRAFARNELIARDSDIVFALVHQDRSGGTENTVGHALRLRKKLFLVDEAGLLYLQKGVPEETTDTAGVAPRPVQAGVREDDTPPV